jgi:cell division protein FtsB
MSAVSDGHKTTAIRRPGDIGRVAVDQRRDSSRFADFTRPVPHERRLVKGRGKRLFFAFVATVIAAALAASLFVLPIKAWQQQRDDLARKQQTLAVLNDAKAQLAADVSRLQTPDGIKEAARQEVGYIAPGEKRISVGPTPNAPIALPTGWPYDAISQIIAVRSASPAVATP